MINNFIRISLRYLGKNLSFTIINVGGLAIGIACSLIMALYVQHELSYDRFSTDATRIYRVVKDFVNDDGTRLPDATTPPALAPAMQSEIPEIESTCRIFPGWNNKFLFKYGDKKLFEERLFRIDSNFFDFFPVPFVQGDAKNAFKEVNNIVCTEAMAQKYFGSIDPMGQILEINNLGSLKVTGVVKELPENAHFHFDFLISTKKFGGNINTNWGFYNFYTYIKLKPNTDITVVEPKIVSVFKKHQPKNSNIYYTQALTDIHLTSHLKWELEPNGDKLYIKIIGLLALVILLIAMINYINLTTAKSSLRAREVGVRKVIGASKQELIRQFLTESFVITFIAGILSIVLAVAVLPAINTLLHKQLILISPSNIFYLTWFGLVVLSIGFLAGIFPALYLSSFKPIVVLKSLKINQDSVLVLRKAMVILQFTLSIALIVGSLMITNQINFIQKAKLGLNKDQVMIIEGAGSLAAASGGYHSLMNELKQIPGVSNVTESNGVLGGQNWTNSLRYKEARNEQMVNFMGIGFDYLKLMGIELKEGRDFSSEYPADSLRQGLPNIVEQRVGSVILNETAVKELGIPSPSLGREIVWAEDKDTIWTLKVIGVTKDFHFTSMRSEIKPFAFVNDPASLSNLTLKFTTGDAKNTLDQVERAWSKFIPDRPFQYSFLDQTFQQLYNSERTFKSVFLWLTALGICIACLGLFALSTFIVEQRIKEIGIRKVLGSTVMGITILLSRDFLKLVFISNLIAFPLSYYFIAGWLQNFAYRVDITWWVFALAGIIALFIATITVSFNTIKAGLSNPLKSLRTE
jgi:putative ABC transport system permease protein